MINSQNNTLTDMDGYILVYIYKNIYTQLRCVMPMNCACLGIIVELELDEFDWRDVYTKYLNDTERVSV